MLIYLRFSLGNQIIFAVETCLLQLNFLIIALAGMLMLYFHAANGKARQGRILIEGLSGCERKLIDHIENTMRIRF